MSLEWDSFGGRPGGGRRHPLVREPDEAGVHDGSDDGANDRGCQVQPGIAEIAGRDHRAQRPRRVEGGAREGSTHDDVEGQCHPDRQRREIAGAARNRGAEYDRHQEKGESTASITKPAQGVTGRVVAPRASVCASAGMPRPVAAPPRTVFSNSAPATPPMSWLTM